MQFIFFTYIDQPPIFTLEPQGAVLATVRDNNAIGASLHCAHSSPNTTLSWYRGTTQITSGGTRTIHDNGTLEFHPLIANADLTPEGVEYHCILSNAFGSVISRTAILTLASKLLLLFFIYGNVKREPLFTVGHFLISLKVIQLSYS